MFTRKELNYLRDPYFRIIREEDQYIEVQSCNTGHCWTVFKNQFEAQYKVTLYHKGYGARNVVATYSGLAKFGNVLIVTIQKKAKTEKLSITGFVPVVKSLF